MFYSSYGNIKLDNTQCSSSNDLDIPKIEVAKEKALKLINIFSDKNNLEDVNKKILIKLINQDIDSYYDIYDKSDKKYYNQNLISEKIKEQSLKIEINRLLNLIINKSNFYITPQIKSKNSNIIPQKEGGIDVELKVAIRSLIKLGEQVANENFLQFYDKLMLIESSLIRLHHAYHIYEKSEGTKDDLTKLKNTRKLVAASVKMGIILEYGYFRKWNDGLEQFSFSLIEPYRFNNDIFKIKRQGDKLHYLLPKYKGYPKCIFEETIKDETKINEQVNITLIKLFSLKDNKDEIYQKCQEFKTVESFTGLINQKKNNNNGVFYEATGKITKY